MSSKIANKQVAEMHFSQKEFMKTYMVNSQTADGSRDISQNSGNHNNSY